MVITKGGLLLQNIEVISIYPKYLEYIGVYLRGRGEIYISRSLTDLSLVLSF